MDELVFSSKKEREFWSIHDFDESSYGIGCKLCGWGPNDPIHGKKDENA